MRWKSRSGARWLLIVLPTLLLRQIDVSAQNQTGASTIEFTQSRYEAAPNAQIASVTLKRTGNTNTAASVDFTTVDSTAFAGADYTAKAGPINFAAGQAEETIAIPLLPRKGGSKMLRLDLSNPTGGAALGPRRAVELILPRVWNTAWLNFGLDQVQPLKTTLFEIPLWQYLASLIYIFLAFYVSKLLDLLIRGRLRQWVRKSSTPLDDLLLELLRGPIKIITFVSLLHVGLRVFAWPDWISRWITKSLHIVVAVSLTYVALKFIDAVSSYWKQKMTGHENKPFSEQLLPIIRNTLKVFTVVVASVLTLQNLGLNVTSLIASLSIGGLALSLAAQDTLSNLFGAVAVLTDKPFLVGDHIKFDQVDGIVEAVGLRSTRVRTIDGNLVSIPNRTMGNAIITQLATRLPPAAAPPPAPHT